MRVFVTGASGHIGSAVVPELIAAGHQVVGLARSDTSAAALTAAGAEVHRGALDDLDSLHRGAAASDGVIHLAFMHDFADYAGAAAADLRAVETIGSALQGSDKPFVITSGTMLLALAAPGRLGIEEVVGDPALPRVASEHAAIALAERGVRSSVFRLAPTVHSSADHHGFVPTLIGIARDKGVSAYVGDGSNRWPAVHTLDAAHLFRIALETAAWIGAARGRRGRRAIPRHRRRHRCPPQRADGRHFHRRGLRPLRLPGRLRVARQPDVECTDTGTHGLAARASGTDPGPQSGSLLHRLDHFPRMITMDTDTVGDAAREALGPVGVYLPLGFASAPTAALQREAVGRLERAGYRAAWTNEVIGGQDGLVPLAVLLAATERMVFGTGIANIWARQPQTMHAAAALLAQAYPGRFVLGLGGGCPEEAGRPGG